VTAVGVDTATTARAVWAELGHRGDLRALVEAGQPPLHVEAGAFSALVEQLESSVAPGPMLSVCVQVASVLPLLRGCAAGSAVADEVLAGMIRGETMVALAVTDAQLSGSGLLDLRTRATRDAGGIVLTGGKEWITNATDCDFALVLARTDGARRVTSHSWVLVPKGRRGVRVESATDAVLAGSGLGHLHFDDVRLDADHLVGRTGRALPELARQLTAERLIGALWARTTCRRILRETRNYLATRSTGQGTLWDNASVQERFAGCLVDLAHLDAMCAAAADVNAMTAAHGMLLKASYASATERILTAVIALRGADSFRDGGMSQLREQLAMFAIAGGATATMLAGVADHAEEFLCPERSRSH